MLIQATNLLGHPVASLQEKKRLGEVINILINRHDAKAIGFIVQIGSKYFGQKFFISDIDIIEIDKYGVGIHSEKDLINPEEIVKAKKIINEKFNLINLKAITKNNNVLGKVFDYVIDTQTMQVTKFYIKNLFNERILTIQDIYRITKKAVIFKDNVGKCDVVESIEKQVVI